MGIDQSSTAQSCTVLSCPETLNLCPVTATQGSHTHLCTTQCYFVRFIPQTFTSSQRPHRNLSAGFSFLIYSVFFIRFVKFKSTVLPYSCHYLCNFPALFILKVLTGSRLTPSWQRFDTGGASFISCQGGRSSRFVFSLRSQIISFRLLSSLHQDVTVATCVCVVFRQENTMRNISLQTT